MKKIFALTIVVATFLGGATFAGSSLARYQCGMASLTEVKVCPMNGEAVTDANAPNEVVGNYKVYFCCAHHKEAFDKLPQEEKDQKIAKALEKQKANQKKT
jgi:YHS domain-containing protein